MDIKFSKESGASQQNPPDTKKNQSALLLLLLILVGGFAYVYFFTGLIKPQETQKSAEAPAAAAPVVKIPLPPREGDVAKPKGKPAVTSETPKVAVPAVVAPAVKAPPAPPAPKSKDEIKNSAVVKPTEKTPLPVSAAGNKVSAAAAKTETKKSAEAETKGVPAKEGVKKPVANDTAKSKAGTNTKSATAGTWSIVVGNYVLEEALSADMGRVRKSGLEPVVKPGSRKKTAMNRLFVSDFTDRASAQSTLEKLKRFTSDAFVIEQGGTFAVYAGSYLQNGAANSEKERLKAAGFATTLKQVDIAIPSQSLTVGPFTSKKAADAASAKLKTVGVKATLSQP